MRSLESSLANWVMQWGKLRSITGRRSSQSSDGQSRSSSPADTERRNGSGVIGALHENPRRTSHGNALSNYGVKLDVVSSHSQQRSQDRRTDPLGLVILYTPERSPSADIIFVHGLGGTSLQTWSRNRDPDLCWPQKWLPLESDISSSRIFSFGYNAHFSSSGSNSIASISDFAKSLLFAMKFGKGEDGEDLKVGSVGSLFIFSLIKTKIHSCPSFSSHIQWVVLCSKRLVLIWAFFIFRSSVSYPSWFPG